MHATQPQAGLCPQPDGGDAAPTADLAGLLTSPARFRSWIAQATTTAVHHADPVGSSLGETPHDSTGCHQNGRPHLGPCIDPTRVEAPGTAGQVLRDAASYLERHGWIQGAYYDATTGSFTPPACLVGAIGMVCYGGPVDAPAQHFNDPGFLDFEEAVLHLDRYLLVEHGSESYEFNDVKGRQVSDVCRVLRDAAARPADELIDAIRAVDAKNEAMATLAELLVPSGVFGSPVVEVANGCDCSDAISGSSWPCADCPGWQSPDGGALR